MESNSDRVRRAGLGDRADIRRIEAACFGWGRYVFGLWPRVGRPDSLTLMAQRRGEASGYLIAYPHVWRGAEEWYIGGLGILPICRRSGLASGLVRSALDTHARLWLHVRPTNAAAISFYRKHGFVDADRILGFYGNGEAALVLATVALASAP